MALKKKKIEKSTLCLFFVVVEKVRNVLLKNQKFSIFRRRYNFYLHTHTKKKKSQKKKKDTHFSGSKIKIDTFFFPEK
jgi:hypothetical protein